MPQKFMRIHESESNWQAEARIISLDHFGNLSGFRFADRTVAPLDLPDEFIEPFYAAYRKLSTLTRKPENEARLQLRAGDALIYDNHRVLHGRTPFSGHRHIRQVYVERERFHSALRVLSERLGRASEGMDLLGGANA